MSKKFEVKQNRGKSLSWALKECQNSVFSDCSTVKIVYPSTHECELKQWRWRKSSQISYRAMGLLETLQVSRIVGFWLCDILDYMGLEVGKARNRATVRPWPSVLRYFAAEPRERTTITQRLTGSFAFFQPHQGILVSKKSVSPCAASPTRISSMTAPPLDFVGLIETLVS